MEFEAKIAKLETLVSLHRDETIKAFEEFNKRDSQIYDLLRDMKGDVSRVMGRTDGSDVNLTVEADNINTIDQSTTQNIVKDGEKGKDKSE